MTTERMHEIEMLLSEAFEDGEFLEELSALETPEEAQSKLREKGVNLTLDEVKQIPKMMAAVSAGTGELSEDDLEDVAGGVIVSVALGAASLAVLIATRRW